MSKSRYFLSNSLTHNIKLRPFNPPILTRIQAFNARVKNAKGDRHVFISKNCKWLLHNIYNLKFKEGTSIVDIPTQKQIKNNRDDKFIRLQAYRYMLNQGMTVTSGCRCKQHNKDEGGVDTSLHIYEGKAATALDFTCNDMQSAYNLACISGLFNEVIWYKSKNFIHIGLDRNQTGDYFITK